MDKKQKNKQSTPTVIPCSLKGSSVCPNPACDGFNRLCLVWLGHSGK